MNPEDYTVADRECSCIVELAGAFGVDGAQRRAGVDPLVEALMYRHPCSFGRRGTSELRNSRKSAVINAGDPARVRRGQVALEPRDRGRAHTALGIANALEL